MRKPKGTMKELRILTKAEAEEYGKLVTKTRTAVRARDKAQFELILIAGELSAKFNRDLLAKWAEDTGLSYANARMYFWLSTKGIDAAFVKKWAYHHKDNPNGLSYSVVRSVVTFAGSAQSPYAQGYLQWAIDHKATKVMTEAYMREVLAPHEDSTGIDDLKVALRDKQDHEGFSDYVRGKLEEILTEHPEAEEQILKTVIADKDDIESLKIAAGIVDQKEQDIVDEATKILLKLKSMRKWLLEHRESITESIAYGHERSVDIQDALKYIATQAANLGGIPIESIFDEDDFTEVTLEAS